MEWLVASTIEAGRAQQDHRARRGVDRTRAGSAAVVTQDVWQQLVGILEETRGGELPVIAVGEAPDADDVTITDRTLFLYVTIEGTARLDNVLGDENVNEFGRLPPITIQGIE